MFTQAGRGLAAAHAAGIVHRDFKPENVLLGKDGRVRVTDFGIARALETAEEVGDPGRGGDAGSLGPQLTRAGQVMGTPGYLAPEQLDGPVSPPTDQFSFCVALYEALTGARPFKAGTFRRLRRCVAHGARDVSGHQRGSGVCARGGAARAGERSRPALRLDGRAAGGAGPRPAGAPDPADGQRHRGRLAGDRRRGDAGPASRRPGGRAKGLRPGGRPGPGPLGRQAGSDRRHVRFGPAALRGRCPADGAGRAGQLRARVGPGPPVGLPGRNDAAAPAASGQRPVSGSRADDDGPDGRSAGPG